MLFTITQIPGEGNRWAPFFADFRQLTALGRDKHGRASQIVPRKTERVCRTCEPNFHIAKTAFWLHFNKLIWQNTLLFKILGKNTNNTAT